MVCGVYETISSNPENAKIKMQNAKLRRPLRGGMNFSVQRRGHPRSVDPSQLTLGAGRVQVLRIDYLRFTIDYVKWWSGFALVSYAGTGGRRSRGGPPECNLGVKYLDSAFTPRW